VQSRNALHRLNTFIIVFYYKYKNAIKIVELGYMDIQLKKSGIGVKEKKSKNHLLYSIKQNLFAYAMLIPTFVCMMCIHFIPMLQGIYMSLLDLNQFDND